MLLMLLMLLKAVLSVYLSVSLVIHVYAVHDIEINSDHTTE